MANKFNDFFINVAQKLVERMEKSTRTINDYLLNPIKNTIFLKPADAAEVSNLILQLDESKATDVYAIPVKLVKLVQYTISEPLSLIFNQCFVSGTFPDKLKLACVTPIHEANSKLALTNYRPISVLPIISKLLEPPIYKKLSNFLDKNKIICDQQFGFQKKKSTSTTVLDIYSKLIDSIEQKKFSCLVFLDFAKAFDIVNHDILLNKLEYYGIRWVALDRFESYLQNRVQMVKVGGVTSNPMTVKCGVP